MKYVRLKTQLSTLSVKLYNCFRLMPSFVMQFGEHEHAVVFANFVVCYFSKGEKKKREENCGKWQREVRF